MLAILSDDLTGALDSAAPFAGRDLHTEVALTRDAVGRIIEGRPDVLSINLNTREISADEARSATAAVISLLPKGTQLFKKIDSRLKGNISAELDAIPFSRALVAPAIPEFGRFVEDGCVAGFGIQTPIVIADRLGCHAASAHIPDAGTSADMDAILTDSENDGTDLLIGARGLAEALAHRMNERTEARAATIPAGRMAFVIGSRDPITLRQIDVLRNHHSLSYIEAPNGHVNPTRDTGSVLMLLQATPGTEEIDPHLVSEALADGLKRYFSDYDGTLFLSGGATAEAVLRRLGLAQLRLHGECLPGLGLASAEGRCIIAKSGGFGQPDTLKQIADTVLRKVG